MVFCGTVCHREREPPSTNQSKEQRVDHDHHYHCSENIADHHYRCDDDDDLYIMAVSVCLYVTFYPQQPQNILKCAQSQNILKYTQPQKILTTKIV